MYAMFSLLYLLFGQAALVSGQGFAANILKFVSSISTPPPIQPEEWDGLEYRYKRLVFRPTRKR